MARLLRFWKPFGVLSQFTDRDGRPTLSDYIDVPGVYAAGRLDMDSEGLLLLTDSGELKTRIADPRHKMRKRYLAFVETPPDAAALEHLRRGVTLRDGPARALAIRNVETPSLPRRDPPPAPRPGRDTGWVELEIDEGRNRQVRRMLAAAGSPVLRLLRTAIGTFTLEGLEPGQWDQQVLHAPTPEKIRTPGTRPRRPDDRRGETRSSGRRRSDAPSSRRRRGS